MAYNRDYYINNRDKILENKRKSYKNLKEGIKTITIDITDLINRGQK